MNKHYEEAERLSGEALPIAQWGLTDRHINATRAVAEATLALAYEQRTANLIAVLGQFEPDYDWLVLANNAPESPEGKRLALMNAVSKQIDERLGLA